MDILETIAREEAGDWHFDALLPTIDYQAIGNVRARLGEHWPRLVHFAQTLDQRVERSSVFAVSPSQMNDPDTVRNLTQAKAMGYDSDNAAHHKAYGDQFPDIFNPVTTAFDLVHARSSMIHQKPGWVCPWHADIFTFYANQHKIADKTQIQRYLVFVEDWSWGHYLLIGNSVVHQWRAGDTITWSHGMRHLSANAGAKPKLTLQVTGLAPTADA